jgi:phage terminase small subunit
VALSYKRRAFVEAYLQTWNATEAAGQAGYKHPNKQGPRLLVSVGIQDAIKARLSEMAMDADEVLVRLSQQATADISDFLKDGGGIDWQKVKEKGYLIKSILHRKGQHTKIELYDAQSALALLGKHYRLFTERHEVDTKIEHVIKGSIRIYEYGPDSDSGA